MRAWRVVPLQRPPGERTRNRPREIVLCRDQRRSGTAV